ncbi:hypothetical protein MJO28_007385 [Puccinia striiformis f. sp. tritici]|uniref:Protein YOP1 n=2 Tax=Puccinia striiformis f. sp. tritici TaxID=168172 RepID=A0A0L0VW58_9BASI|nr:hypothetical protein Pst134EA_013494 [Puccinia striiformis f. sp. tritici]KAI9603873.1 hypothetical protein H4Q26_003478 [Puccinia striiformis f. sp. tritici PST-130]KNF03437.1 hypothetical protein PSTG_03378 [Puccinia striiformis f. sp. tritici PST-78]KAH9454390.1 hypothetical protein Pst134EB_014475 [Puccinia striiformis f. sp. tritici]KAH9465613.1 hypothetical protein Pst134EA_013494 [Puccinia striiformis f. sp. tritici]KAI7951701.1 hypothetical protein MJO28_007385 [Puccinia striiformis
MGLFAFVSFLVVTSLGTLYPIYLSYKAIKNNDLQSLEILLMFWIVMGTINAIESTCGWFLHWIPFFYQFKSVFILWLTLPQIQGSTYVYVTYVHPFLLEHEVDIDTWLIDMKQKCRQAGTTYFYQFVDRLKALLLTAMLPTNDPHHPNPTRVDNPANLQAHQLDAASTYAFNLIRQFGPTASAIFNPMQNRGTDPSYLHPNNNSSSGVGGNSNSRASSQQSTQRDGYQIPEYDQLPTGGSLFSRRKSHETLNPPSSIHSAVSRERSSESLRTTAGQADPAPTKTGLFSSSRPNNSTLTGYDEIGRDEASGSENEWLLRKPSPVGSTSSFNLRGRLSEGNNNQTPINPPLSQRSVSSTSKWFNWSSTKPATTTDVDESRKTK